MTLLRLALRSHRGGLIAATVVGVLLALGNTIGYAQIAGADPQARAIFARQMEIVGRQFTYMLPLPLQLETLAGYLQWRHFGALPLVYTFWAILAASGAARGDEERGLVELWLAARVPRLRYLLTRVVAFAAVAAASIAVMLAAAFVGSIVADERLDVGALALQGVDLTALALCCFAVVLVMSQVTATRRGAAGAGAVLLVGLFLINSAARVGGLGALRPLSPFWAYERSTPLLRGGALDDTAIAALLVATLVLVIVAAGAFRARDIGASLLRTAARTGRRLVRPSGDPLLRVPVLSLLDQQRTWIAGWAVGLAVLAAFLISLTRTMVDALLEIPTMRAYFERLGTLGYDTFVGVIWGSTALLLVSLFAIFQVGAWVADDAEGRLEAVLAQPVSRTRVVLERLGALLLGTAIVVLVASVGVALSTSREGIEIAPDKFWLASALMPTVPFAFGAVGAVFAHSRPRLAVPVLTTVAIASYFTQQFAPLFDWPEWLENTSIFALYGTPMTTGVEWGGITALVALGIAGTVLAVVAMRRRDVGR